MANHVHTVVTFHQISDEGKNLLKSLYENVRKDQNYYWFSDIFVDGKEGSPSYEDVNTYGFNVDHVGSKWCYFEDFSEDYFVTESAWSYPEDGINWVLAKVGEVDPNFIASVTYEDEMPNFMGVYIYNSEGLVDGFEEDYEEICERLLLNVEGLKEHWNEEDQEFTDEGFEIFIENVWEVISDAQQELIAETVSCLKNPIDE